MYLEVDSNETPRLVFLLLFPMLAFGSQDASSSTDATRVGACAGLPQTPAVLVARVVPLRLPAAPAPRPGYELLLLEADASR
jgi:hypothetical protein